MVDAAVLCSAGLRLSTRSLASSTSGSGQVAGSGLVVLGFPCNQFGMAQVNRSCAAFLQVMPCLMEFMTLHTSFPVNEVADIE